MCSRHLNHCDLRKQVQPCKVGAVSGEPEPRSTWSHNGRRCGQAIPAGSYGPRYQVVKTGTGIPSTAAAWFAAGSRTVALGGGVGGCRPTRPFQVP